MSFGPPRSATTPPWEGNLLPRQTSSATPPQDGNYQDIKGFCKSAKRDEVEKHGFVLTPGRYVGIKEVEDDGIPFEEKMQKLTSTLREQFAKENEMNAEIKKQLAKIGFEI